MCIRDSYCGRIPLLKFKTLIYHCYFPTVASLRTQCQVKAVMAELKRSANAAIIASAIWYIWELFRKDKFSSPESEFNRELKQRRQQQERRKTKQQICTCIMLLSMLLDYNVKFHSNAHVLWRAWTRASNFLFFPWTWVQSFKIQLQKNSSTLDKLNEIE